MMSSVWIAALFALFVWWFSTGVILLVVRRADRSGGNAHRMAVLAGLPVLALGVVGVFASISDISVLGTYVGFLAALAIWGWIELAFLTGTITGPSVSDCPAGSDGQDRLRRAWDTLAHHELLLLGGLLVIIAASQGAENSIALWTYLVLFIARICAKLNLYFGVPYINLEFVPRPLEHLKSYFRQGPITPAFPIAITVLSFTLACFMLQLWTAATAGETVGFALLAALAGLALVEHWLMVLPLPDAKLWRWMLPALNTPKPRHLSPSMNPNER